MNVKEVKFIKKMKNLTLSKRFYFNLFNKTHRQISSYLYHLVLEHLIYKRWMNAQRILDLEKGRKVWHQAKCHFNFFTFCSMSLNAQWQRSSWQISVLSVKLQIQKRCQTQGKIGQFLEKYVVFCSLWTKLTKVQGVSGGSRIFPGGANPQGGGRRDTILLNFPENCMKSRRIWPLGGDARRGRPPP